MSGNIIKIMPCKGFCDLFKEKPIPKDRYISAKYCRTCEAWFLRTRCGIKCACCKMIYDDKQKKWV